METDECVLAERYAHGADAFHVLPQDVKDDLIEKWREEERRCQAYQARLRERSIKAMLLGLFGAAIISACVPGGSWNYVALMAVSSAILGHLIVLWRSDHLLGFMLYGANAVLISSLCMHFSGGCWSDSIQGGFSAGMMFSSWIFHVIIGGMIARLTEDKRQMEDAF
ncbi:MAG TPA: hypothetical protein VEK08_16845 [Planctomycetota bacterium]|nr:hypothetical protein [Planctomycetota bacterium]